MYTEEQLVDFGNYLLELYGVKDKVTGNFRVVGDWDLANWSHFKENVLPSAYQIGDKVKVFKDVYAEDKFDGMNATIIAVHFTKSKVKYDVEISFLHDTPTRIYNVDSFYIKES